MPNFKREFCKTYGTWLGLGIAILAPIGTSNLYASAFALNEQNVSGLGNAYAGRTAIAEDISTSFYNPAGLVRFKCPQALASVVNPLANFDVKMNSATRANGAALTDGSDKQDASKYTPIPAFHLGGALANNMFYGLSVTAPFGLGTNYSRDSQFRYFATSSEIKVIDVNPNLAFKVDNNWSVGVGASVQYASAVLKRRFDNASIVPTTADGRITIDLDSVGYGFNVGALYQPSSSTRLGFAFRSQVKHDADGKFKADNILPAVAAGLGVRDQDAKATLTLPEVVSISSFQTLNSDWDVMGDITYTNWHRFKKLLVKFPDTNLATLQVDQRFRNTFKVALGANYKYRKNLTWKFGTAFDKSPVKAEHRIFRLPDSDRIWLSTGFKYNVNRALDLDVGYSYIFLKNSKVTEASTTTLATSDASVKSGINLLGLQLTYNL